MGLIAVLIGYILDYKEDKNNFLKEFAVGFAFFAGNFILALVLQFVFGIPFLYCIFGFAIEILLLFSIKAYVQNKDV
ncbi:MAG: hypothetical protein ACI9Y7_001454 [Dokdonia sp.]|jgi:hypothetical protein